MPKGYYERKPPTYLITGSKVCADCKMAQSVDNFKLLKHTNRRYSYCTACSYERERKRWRSLPQKEQRAKWLKSKFDLTWDEYISMYAAQNKTCAICLIPISIVSKGRNHTTACVDHCHSSGKIRGLLCNHCNRALGLLKDNLETIKRMEKYLG